MIVWGLSEHEIHEAAERSEVEIRNLRKDGRGYRFTLRLTPSKRWQKLSNNPWSAKTPWRKTAAVCWHGHFRFMRECFVFNESARIKTGWADYRGLDSFLSIAPTTGLRNIGSMMYPVQAQESCNCIETGDYIISTH